MAFHTYRIMEGQQQYILTLPAGVDREELSNYIADWDARLLEGIQPPEPPVQVASDEPVPEWFTEGEEWPFTCMLQCWNCLLEIEGPPFFVPDEIRMVTPTSTNRLLQGGATHAHVRSFKRKNKSLMCGINCAVSYINFSMHGEHAFQCKERTIQLYHAMFRIRVITIVPAPRFTAQKQFGGDMDPDEYRNAVAALEPQKMDPFLRAQTLTYVGKTAHENHCWFIDEPPPKRVVPKMPASAPGAVASEVVAPPVVSIPDADIEDLLDAVDTIPSAVEVTSGVAKLLSDFTRTTIANMAALPTEPESDMAAPIPDQAATTKEATPIRADPIPTADTAPLARVSAQLNVVKATAAAVQSKPPKAAIITATQLQNGTTPVQLAKTDVLSTKPTKKKSARNGVKAGEYSVDDLLGL